MIITAHHGDLGHLSPKGQIMRKGLVSVTAAVAVAVPLALAGTAAASPSAPAHLSGYYITSMGQYDHMVHLRVLHAEHVGCAAVRWCR